MQEHPNETPGGVEIDAASQLPAANDAAPETNYAADLEKQLGDALAEAAKLKEALLRAAADSDNMRKRALAESENARKYALEGFSTELLQVRDSLEAALSVENATLESYRNGVELTLRQLNAAFDKFGIKEINPAGERFDPHRHQAMALVDSGQEPNSVVAVMQKGYSLNDRVLRPALVSVQKPPA